MTPHPMPSTGWRNACLAFALLSAVLAWRNCTRRVRPTVEACARLDRDRGVDRSGADDDDRDRPRNSMRTAPKSSAGAAEDEYDGSDEAWKFSVPAWVMWLAPQPGEDLLHYRDRMVPLAQQAVAPHRSRVARGRDDFAQLAHLDNRQRAELDAAVDEAAETIQDRVFSSALAGDLNPANFKPSTAVALGRDVLDAVDRANRRFAASLSPEQRAQLAQHPFDVADYLLFSTKWEDALGASD